MSSCHIVPIDYIGGTSQGACIGGLYAMFDDLEEASKRAFFQANAFSNILSVSALKSSNEIH